MADAVTTLNKTEVAVIAIAIILLIELIHTW